MVAATARLSLIWPDGSIVSGASYRELEDALRATQWHEYRSRRAFRSEMRRRSGLWSGSPVRSPLVPQTSEEFVRSLAASGMCMLDES